MSSLSNAQLGNVLRTEEQIRKKKRLNPDTGFVGNGFWWAGYPTYTDQLSGFGQNESYGPPNEPVSPMGETTSAGAPAGLQGLPVN
jgi:hypothetical protein